MRFAIISDIHSNLPALEAVLVKITELGVDSVLCLGDTIGYGPFPNECVDLVRKNCVLSVKGNHDSGVLGETSIDDFNQFGQDAIRWTDKNLLDDYRSYIAKAPLIAVYEGLTIVHSSPDTPGDWKYVMTMHHARESFKAFSTDICFIGHTHVPVVIGEDSTINSFHPPRREGNPISRFLINVGSVGQPRDGNPHAAFGVLDTIDWSYTLVRTEYDIKKTASAITSAGLPKALAQRLFQGV
ncbi:MAG: metallophosphoesterase family protein [Bacteroidota bacterium]